jgi:hypothetical protein
LERTRQENPPGDRSSLRRLLARRHSVDIRLHHRRRSLPSRLGSKGAAPSRGRVARTRARRSHRVGCPEQEIHRDYLHTRKSWTLSSTATLTAHQDARFRTEDAERRNSRKIGSAAAAQVRTPQPSTRTSHHVRVTVEEIPIPSRPGSRAPHLRQHGHQMAEKYNRRGSAQPRHHDTTTRMPPLAAHRNTQLDTAPPTQDGAFSKETAPTRCHRQIEIFGFSPVKRRGEWKMDLNEAFRKGNGATRRLRRDHHRRSRDSPGLELPSPPKYADLGEDARHQRQRVGNCTPGCHLLQI